MADDNDLSSLEQALMGSQQAPPDAPAPPPSDPSDSGGGQDISSIIRSMIPQGAPMVQGGRPALTPQEQNAPPKPGIGGLPGLIMGLIHPANGTPAGQPAPSRLDHFENFVGNFLQSLSAGFQTPPGPGAGIRSAGAAMAAPYQTAVNRWQQGQGAQAQAATIAQQKAQTDQTQAQTKMIGSTIPATMPDSTQVNIPANKYADFLKARLGYDKGVDVQDKKNEGAKALVGLKEGMGLPVPKEVAVSIGQPELEGKVLGKNGWDLLNKKLTAQGKNLAVGDIGNGNVGIFKKDTGEVVKNFGAGQRLISTQAGAKDRAYWQAKFGVVAVQDENGTHYESRLDAPGMATAAHSYDVVKGKAGLANYKDALTRMDDNMDVMQDGNQRALIAQTMRQIGTVHDPGIISATLGNMVSEGMTPKAADLVAATLQAREFIGANRQFAGNFQGSEALYQRMVSNVPGPMNSIELNRKLIKQDKDNTTRIEQQLSKFQNPKGNKDAQKPPIVSPTGKKNPFAQ